MANKKVAQRINKTITRINFSNTVSLHGLDKIEKKIKQQSTYPTLRYLGLLLHAHTQSTTQNSNKLNNDASVCRVVPTRWDDDGSTGAHRLAGGPLFTKFWQLSVGRVLLPRWTSPLLLHHHVGSFPSKFDSSCTQTNTNTYWMHGFRQFFYSFFVYFFFVVEVVFVCVSVSIRQ